MDENLFAPNKSTLKSNKFMRKYHYQTEQLLPIELEDAWTFFSSPNNLALITPPELDFKVLSKLDNTEIYEGMLIDYKVRPLFGIPVKWRTEIGKMESRKSFMDRQIRGPYKMWEHTHTFEKKDNGVLMKDEITYELPFGLIGAIAHKLLIRRKIEHIFAYRKKILTNIFTSYEFINK